MSTAFTPKKGLDEKRPCDVAKRSRKIVYPDSDGRPIADNTRQFRWIVIIKEGLDILFADRQDVFVAGDLLWYAEEGKPKVRMAPDAMVVFGRPKGDRGSYMQWVEEGIAPQVVFEVHSPGNRRATNERKFRFYEDHGVEEYYYYNPDNGKLTGWRRSRGKLRPIPDLNGYMSPRLGIRFEPGKGPDSLRIIGPDGEVFISPVEMANQRKRDRKLLESERERAESERERADRLAARLRALGLDAD
ncbi:Uma2 family endonuclease [Aquisphaera insulae]|uniref:Uma2 family endonuclease n=1 Tax=Aquisphaera insulae TaxID=2712864 RepID=UPI0013ECE061|nr:Uma2 family endonuclease [Aquisphaera insulae]